MTVQRGEAHAAFNEELRGWQVLRKLHRTNHGAACNSSDLGGCGRRIGSSRPALVQKKFKDNLGNLGKLGLKIKRKIRKITQW